jgi:hypothetical protein
MKPTHLTFQARTEDEARNRLDNSGLPPEVIALAKARLDELPIRRGDLAYYAVYISHYETADKHEDVIVVRRMTHARE